MPPLLIIRADADVTIGTGHVMRCLALAQEWRRQGGEVVFFGRIASEYLRQRIEGEDCRLCLMETIHPDPADLASVLSWLEARNTKAGWLVLDGYHFDTAYHDAIRAVGWRLLVIDDYRHLPVYHADILLNPNAYAADLAYITLPTTQRLMGTRFTLLRREFMKGVIRREELAAVGWRILVTMGGADPENVSGKVLDALLVMQRKDLKVKIVVGPLNPHRLALAAKAEHAPFAVELLKPVADMVPLMQWADLAISAAGSTCWELVALGVPTLVTVLAENQDRVASYLVGHGVAYSLGWFADWQPKEVAMVVNKLLADNERRRHMNENGRILVDSLGCARVVKEIKFAYEH